MAKRQPINNLNEIISENEVQLFEWSFEDNPNIISLLIENHIKKSPCKACTWKLMVFGFLDKDETKKIREKNCFYKINLDLLFINPNLINEVKEKFSILEDEGFKPIPLDGVGDIILYCE